MTPQEPEVPVIPVQPSGPVPVITSNSSFTYPRTTSAVTIGFTATNNVTSWSATNLPNGLTLNSTTGILSGTTYETAGNRTIVVTASNANGSATQSVTLTLYNLPLPAFTSPSVVAYIPGAPVNYTVMVDTIASVEIDGSTPLPQGLTFNPTTRKITGTTYVSGFTIKIWAINSAGQVSLTLVNDTVPPGAPQNLHSTEVTATKVRLEWDPPTDNLALNNYGIYKNGLNVAASSVNTNYTEVIGLTPNTTYTFKITARDASTNESAFSNEISVTTLAS